MNKMIEQDCILQSKKNMSFCVQSEVLLDFLSMAIHSNAFRASLCLFEHMSECSG